MAKTVQLAVRMTNAEAADLIAHAAATGRTRSGYLLWAAKAKMKEELPLVVAGALKNAPTERHARGPSRRT